jgi:hypothetical protein
MTIAYLSDKPETIIALVSDVFPGPAWEDEQFEVSRGHFYLPFSEITDEEVEKLLTAYPQRDTTTLFQSYDGSELAIAIHGGQNNNEFVFHIHILKSYNAHDFSVKYDPKVIY